MALPAHCILTGHRARAAGTERPRTGLSESNRRRELDRAIHIARGAHAHGGFMERLRAMRTQRGVSTWQTTWIAEFIIAPLEFRVLWSGGYV